MEFFGRDGGKVLWELQYNRIIEEATDHDEIGLRGFDLNFSAKKIRG